MNSKEVVDCLKLHKIDVFTSSMFTLSMQELFFYLNPISNILCVSEIVTCVNASLLQRNSNTDGTTAATVHGWIFGHRWIGRLLTKIISK